MTATAIATSGLAPAAAAGAATPTALETIAITAPSSGLVSGVVTVQMQASGLPASLSLYLDGQGPYGTSPAEPPLVGVQWDTQFAATGWHALTARACYVDLSCVTSAPIVVYVYNPRPTITEPTSGSRVSGIVRVTADAGDVTPQGVEFYLSGSFVGYDTTAPYSVLIDMGRFPDGPRSFTAAFCDSRWFCSARRSDPVRVVVASLHPPVLRQTPAAFSPDADGVLDQTATVFSLPTRQAVTWEATTHEGRVVRGPVRLGVLSAGEHTYTWDGRDNQGRLAPDARYRIVVRSKAGPLFGRALSSVVLDTVEPQATDIKGDGATVYPYPDKYRDSVVLGYRPAQDPDRDTSPVTATARIVDSRGRVVRSLTAPTTWGPQTLGWNGRTASGKLVPDGTYRWRLTLRDASGNTWTSPRYSVSVSSKRTVRKTLVVTVDAASVATKTPTEPCATTKPSGYGASGILLDNACDPVNGLQPLEVTYAVTLPTAISYGPATIEAYGESSTGAETYAWLNVSKAGTGYNPTLAVPVTSGRWLDYGAQASFVPPDGKATVGFAVIAGWNGPHSVDLRYLRVTVPAVVLV